MNASRESFAGGRSPPGCRSSPVSIGRRHDGGAGGGAADDGAGAIALVDGALDRVSPKRRGQPRLVAAAEPDAGDAVEPRAPRPAVIGLFVCQNDPLGVGAALAEVLGQLESRVGILRRHREDDDARAVAPPASATKRSRIASGIGPPPTMSRCPLRRVRAAALAGGGAEGVDAQAAPRGRRTRGRAPRRRASSETSPCTRPPDSKSPAPDPVAGVRGFEPRCSSVLPSDCLDPCFRRENRDSITATHQPENGSHDSHRGGSARMNRRIRKRRETQLTIEEVVYVEILLGSSADLVRGARRAWTPTRRRRSTPATSTARSSTSRARRFPGGTATLTGPIAPRTTTVDAGGQFRFLKVPAGKYSVVVTMPGFTTVTQENVIVSVGRNTQVDVKMRISNVQENVTVSGATPLDRHAQGRDRRDLLARRADRDPDRARRLVPHPAGARRPARHRQRRRRQSAVAGGPNFISKGSGNVVYQVDGVDDHRQHLRQPVRRARTAARTRSSTSTRSRTSRSSTGGSLLEQQNSGVTINVVTKRGTNEIKGSARYLYASGNWQSNNQSAGGDRPGHSRPTTSAIDPRVGRRGLGGPIVKDKLWLWFAGSRQTSTPTPGAARTSARVSGAAGRQPRALEREAELAGRQLELAAALLPAQRPDRVRPHLERRRRRAAAGERRRGS